MRFLVAIAACLSLAMPAFASQSSESSDGQATAPSPTYPCKQDDRHRAFDFWIGDWDVFQNDALAGRNRITSILGGCLIFEEWQSASGSLGKSFNYYDPSKDHWRQIWVADSGSIIEFTGKARDGGIFYTAETSESRDRRRNAPPLRIHRTPERGCTTVLGDIDGSRRVDNHLGRTVPEASGRLIDGEDDVDRNARTKPPGDRCDRLIRKPSSSERACCNTAGNDHR